MTTIEITCPRCNGTDFVARFANHDRGHCYRCRGRGVIRQRVHDATGTPDCDHFLTYQGGGAYTDKCGRCALPVADWPPVVTANRYVDQFLVYGLPGQVGAFPAIVPAPSTREGRAAVRRLVAEQHPTARIRWGKG